MNPIVVVIALIWVIIIIIAIKAFLERGKPPRLDEGTPTPRRNGVEHKEGGMMSRSDVSDSVMSLLDSGKISWPRSVSDRNKFIAEKLGKVWDALLDINIHANIGIATEEDELHVSGNEHNSRRAWEALGEVLMLVLILEDALGIDITPLSEYDKLRVKYGEPTDISTYKAKIRSRVRS